jgi:hypothetical protein
VHFAGSGIFAVMMGWAKSATPHVSEITLGSMAARKK